MRQQPLDDWLMVCRGFMAMVSALGIFGAVAPALRASPLPPEIAIHVAGERSLRLAWPAAAAGFVLETTDRLGHEPLWQTLTTAPQVEGNLFTVSIAATDATRFFRLRLATVRPLTTIHATSPVDGEAGVSVTRETIVRFSAPLAVDTVLTSEHFYASFGGRRLQSRVELASDRLKATLFYLEQIPGSARIQVVFDGTGVRGANGQPLDPDGDGNPGGVMTLAFSTVSTTEVAGTAVIGHVYASELAPGPDDSQTKLPLAGVTITVDGAEQTMRAVTDAEGYFRLTPAPAGRFFVHVDGRTVTNAALGIRYPDLAYYPYIGKAWEAVPGRPDNLAGATGEIYLPRISATTLVTPSPTTATEVPLPADVLADHPELEGMSITIPAKALFSDNGTRGGKIGIAPVSPERLPEPLPPGLSFPIVFTIQTDGPSNFDQPVTVRFPNLPDPLTGIRLPPGAKAALWSFNHDTGRWEVVGPGTVTEDGRFIESDPGVGILQPGWHSFTGSGGGGGSGDDPPPMTCPSHLPEPIFDAAAADAATTVAKTNPPVVSPMIFGESGVLSNPSLTWQPPVDPAVACFAVEIQVDGPLSGFMRKSGTLDLISQRFLLNTASRRPKVFSARAKTYDELVGQDGFVYILDDIFYGAAIKIKETTSYQDGRQTVLHKTFYQYRFVNVTQPAEAARRRGSTLVFRKTLNDGPGGWSSFKPVTAGLPKSVPTVFRPSSARFKTAASVSGKLLEMDWEFDPMVTGSNTDALEISVADGLNTRVGVMTLLGTGAKPVAINLNLQGYKAELKRVIKALRNVYTAPDFIAPAYPFSYDNLAEPPAIIRTNLLLPGGIRADADVLNPAPQGAFGNSAGKDGIRGTVDDVIGYRRFVLASGRFQELFRGFMPEDRAIVGPDRITGSPDDFFSPEQERSLDQRIEAEAAALLDAVRADFAAVVGPNETTSQPILWVDTPGDVKVQWTDAFATTGGGVDKGTNGRGVPIFGFATFGMNKGDLEPILKDPRIPFTAKHWALAENLNLPEDQLNPPLAREITASVARNLDFLSTGSLAEYVANTVSHELGHTFGLLDAYVDPYTTPGTAYCQPDSNCLPFDLMRSGQRSDPDLTFASENVRLLQAGLGISPGRKQLPLAAALAQFRRTFNLARSAVGIRENQPSDQEPNDPILGVTVDGEDFFGDGDETPASVGVVVGGGGSAMFRDLRLAVENIGSGKLIVTNVALADGTKGFHILNAVELLGKEIQAGATHAIDLIVRFAPTAPGAMRDQIVFRSNAAFSPLFALTLAGKSGEQRPTAQLDLLQENNFGGVPLVAGIRTIPELVRITNLGAEPLSIRSAKLVSGAHVFSLAGLPLSFPGAPIMLAQQQAIVLGARFDPDKAGLARGVVELETNDPKRPKLSFSIIGTGLGTTVYPEWGMDYAAVETPDAPGAIVRRTRSNAAGRFDVFLPASTFYRAVVFDPATGLIGVSTGFTEPSGEFTQVDDTMSFGGSTAPDSDFDGLPDDVEFAIGTSPVKADTDGNGLEDAAEIAQGLNPLGGRAVPTGVVARVPIQGEALEVVVEPGPPSGPAQIACVAAGTGGLAVIDVTDFTQPVLLNQIVLPGSTIDVAVSSTLGIAVAAAGPSGLHLVDVSRPARPDIIGTLPIHAVQIEVAGDLAFVGQGEQVLVVDLAARSILQAEPLSPYSLGVSKRILSLARDGSTLCALSDGGALRVFETQGVRLVGRGGRNYFPPPSRVVVGGGIAFLPVPLTGLNNGGYATIDLRNPDDLRLLSDPDVPPETRAPGTTLALNGSGLGLLAGSDGTVHALDVMDVSNPQQTYSFVTRFELPAPPNSVTIASGVAFVATGAQGLAVVNFLPFDIQGTAPTLSLFPPPDADPATPGVQAFETTTVSLRADLRDDVQVRNVELLLNGQVARNDLSFPFDLSFTMPRFSGTGARLTVQIRATDTGGNTALSDPLTIDTIEDQQPPRILATAPAEDGLLFAEDTRLTATFSEPIEPATINTANVQLLDPLGHTMPLESVTLQSGGHVLRITYNPLAADSYRLVLRAAQLTDLAGNALGDSDTVLRFVVAPIARREFTVRWINPAGGAWTNTMNWSPNRVPVAGDHVLIDPADPHPNAVIFLPNSLDLPELWNPRTPGVGPIRFANLVSSLPVKTFYTVLQPSGMLLVNNRIAIGTSTVAGGTLLSGPGTLLSYNLPGEILPHHPITGLAEPLWDGVTWRGDVELVNAWRFHTVTNGLTIQGTINGLVDYSALPDPRSQGFLAHLHCIGTNTLAGAAVLNSVALQTHANGQVYPDNTFSYIGGAAQLTIGPGIRMCGRGAIQASDEAIVINKGTLHADLPGNAAFRPWFWVLLNPGCILINEGVIDAADQSWLLIQGGVPSGYAHLAPRPRFINRHVLRARPGATVEMLAVDYQSAETVAERDSLFHLVSEVATEPGRVAAFAGAGAWVLQSTPDGLGGVHPDESATFTGGTVALSDDARFSGPALLQGLTLNGNLDLAFSDAIRAREADLPAGLQNMGRIEVRQGLTLNGTLDLRFANSTGQAIPAVLGFREGAQALEGRGTVLFGAAPGNALGRLDNEGTPLTLGRDITIRGASFGVGYHVDNLEFITSRGPLVNRGTIQAEAAGGTVSISPGAHYAWENAGTVAVLNGATLKLGGDHFINQGNLTSQDARIVTTMNHSFVNEGNVWTDSRSLLTVNGGFTQTPSGILRLDIAGTQPGITHGHVVINGTATLAGKLDLAVVDPFRPALGATFDILTWGARTGAFEALSGTALSNGIVLKPDYQPTSFRIIVDKP